MTIVLHFVDLESLRIENQTHFRMISLDHLNHDDPVMTQRHSSVRRWHPPLDNGRFSHTKLKDA